LFILALGAGKHWPDTEPVSQNLSANTASAIIDREFILDAVQRVTKDRIVKLWEGLHVFNFVVVDHRKLSERLVAIGFGCIGPVGSRREPSLVWTSDDGVQISMHDGVDAEHLENRLAGFRVTHRIDRVIVDDRLTAGRGAGLGQYHVRRGKLRAIPLGTARFDVDAAK